MQKQTQSQLVSCSLPPSTQESKKPSMASQQEAEPTCRSGVTDDDARSHAGAENDPLSSAAEDFEFCILSSGGLALAGGEDAADMCVADEVFSGGKLLPFRFSSAKSADAPPSIALLRSDSTGASTSTSGFSSRSVSRSTSSSSSSCVSRSTSSKSASSNPVASCSSTKGAMADTAVPPRRSLSSSVFYAHPSPSPRPPPRRSAAASSAAARRRSTGTAPPASWGVIRLGVVGAPKVYAPRPAGEHRKAAATVRAGSRSARFDRSMAATKEDKKLGLGLLGAGLVCSCSPDAVAPVGSAEVAAAEARRRRKKAEEKKRASKSKQSGQQGTARRSRILEWLEELSLSSKEKSVV